MDRPEETTIWEGKSSLLRANAGYFATIALSIPLFALGLAYEPLGILTGVCPLVGMGSALIIAYRYCRGMSRRYRVTSERITAKSGILFRTSVEVRPRDIRSIATSQGLSQRLGGVGNILVSSAGTAGVEVCLDGVEGFERLADQIRELQSA